jgi:hypothetical protein
MKASTGFPIRFFVDVTDNVPYNPQSTQSSSFAPDCTTPAAGIAYAGGVPYEMMSLIPTHWIDGEYWNGFVPGSVWTDGDITSYTTEVYTTNHWHFNNLSEANKAKALAAVEIPGPNTHLITCTATDEAGNVGTASFTVTVNYTPPATESTETDTTPPVLTMNQVNSEYGGPWSSSGCWGASQDPWLISGNIMPMATTCTEGEGLEGVYFAPNSLLTVTDDVGVTSELC